MYKHIHLTGPDVFHPQSTDMPTQQQNTNYNNKSTCTQAWTPTELSAEMEPVMVIKADINYVILFFLFLLSNMFT